MDIRVRQREKAIIEYLNEHNNASVTELSDMLSVSSVTIRRDLIRMDKEKKILRYHGGVRSRDESAAEPAIQEFQQKSGRMREEKQRIGLRACKFVNDGDIVFVNSGTTVLQFLQQLEKNDVTIVTNNAASLSCSLNAGIEMLVLGGVYNKRTRAMGGEITTNSLAGIYSTCTILGVNALDTVEGMTTSVYEESTVNNAMINHTRGMVILLADSTKMGKISSYVSAPLSKIDVIITDTNCSQECIDSFKHQNIEVIMA